jgi:hypothetical protein
MAIFPLLFIR